MLRSSIDNDHKNILQFFARFNGDFEVGDAIRAVGLNGQRFTVYRLEEGVYFFSPNQMVPRMIHPVSVVLGEGCEGVSVLAEVVRGSDVSESVHHGPGILLRVSRQELAATERELPAAPAPAAPTNGKKNGKKAEQPAAPAPAAPTNGKKNGKKAEQPAAPAPQVVRDYSLEQVPCGLGSVSLTIMIR